MVKLAAIVAVCLAVGCGSPVVDVEQDREAAVQYANNLGLIGWTSSSTTMLAQFNGAQAAGDANVVIVGWRSGSATVTSVTDSAGNRYQQVAHLSAGGNSEDAWVAFGVKAGNNTVTVRFSASVPYRNIFALEYRGAPDTAVGYAASGTGSPSQVLVQALSGDAVAAGNYLGSGSSQGVLTGFTQLGISGLGDLVETRAISADGQYGPGASLSSGAQWIQVAVVLRASGGQDAGADAGQDAGADAGQDAGVDAGQADAGIDAGVDAGADAGQDGGAPDAGQPDAGAADSGYYTPVVDLGLPGGQAPQIHWAAGERLVAQDPVGLDLIGLASGPYAFVSPDQGQTWHWVLGAGFSGVPMAVAVDDQGRLHVLTLGSGRINYSRLALSRDSAGHVVGFGAEASDIPLPPSIETLSATARAGLLAVRDAAGVPTLVWFAFDGSGSAGHLYGGRVVAAAGTSPTAASQFGALDGTAGSSTFLWSYPSGVFSAPHNSGFSAAQIGITSDIRVQVGPTETGDTSAQNSTPLQELLLAATPQGWALSGPPTTLDQLAGRTPQVASAQSGQGFAWFLRFSPAMGLIAEKVDAAGARIIYRLPSSVPPGQAGALGSAVLSVAQDQQRFAVGVIDMYDSATSPQGWFGALYWDGAGWTVYPDHLPTAASWQDGTPQDCWGMGAARGRAGWCSRRSTRTAAPSAASRRRRR
jgi:hypothetical protein